jgi:hypothetical protein
MARNLVSSRVARLVTACALTAALGAPACAQASDAHLDRTGKLNYDGAPSEVNRLVASVTGTGTIQLTDNGVLGTAPITVRGTQGCSSSGATATCTGVTATDLKLGDGDDTIDARNGYADKIGCGPGTDSVLADPADVVAPDCESVDRSAPAAPTSDTSDQGTTPGIDPNASLPLPTIPAQTATVTPGGIALVQVACPADAGRCSGTAALVIQAGRRDRVAAAARRRRTAALGSSAFTAAGGTKAVVRVRLNRRGRRMAKRGSVHCRLVVTTRTADGKTIETSRAITMRERRTPHRPKPRRKKH